MRKMRKRFNRDLYAERKPKNITVTVHRCAACNCYRCLRIRAVPKRLHLRCDCRFCEYRREFKTKSLPRSIAVNKPYRKTKEPDRLSSEDLLKTGKEFARDKKLKESFNKAETRKRLKRKIDFLKRMKREKLNRAYYDSDTFERHRAKKASKIVFKKACSFIRYLTALAFETQPKNFAKSYYELLMTRLLKVGYLIDILKKVNPPSKLKEIMKEIVLDQTWGNHENNYNKVKPLL